jgi:hypothetical protein
MKVHDFASSGTPRVFVIHENDAWVEPLRRELAILGAPFSEWFLDQGILISVCRRPKASSTIG